MVKSNTNHGATMNITMKTVNKITKTEQPDGRFLYVINYSDGSTFEQRSKRDYDRAQVYGDGNTKEPVTFGKTINSYWPHLRTVWL